MTSPVAASGTLGPAGPRAQPRHPDLRALLSTPGSRVVLLDGSRDPTWGVTMLLTAPGSTEPRLAVKVATARGAAGGLEREAGLLVELRRRPLPRVDRPLPRHAGVFDADGMLAVATSVVPGVPMRTRYHAFRHLARPGSVRGDFAAARDWLTALHADSMAAAAPIALLDGVAAQVAARWPDGARAVTLADPLGPPAAPPSAPRPPRTRGHVGLSAG